MPLRDQFYANLNESQSRQLSEEYASDVHVASPKPGPYAYTLTFHESFGFPVSQSLVLNPSVSDRLRRGKLIFEEVMETLTKGLGLTLIPVSGENGKVSFELIHREGDLYDPVETADGIGDINVVANGTAIEFGIPMPSIDHEVFCSNMTKLVDGQPILNICVHEGCPDPLCDFAPHFIDPTAPKGKGLKPDTYTPANIVRILQTHIEQFGAE